MPSRRRFHRARLFVQALFALVVIVFALIVGIARLALPWVASHPQQVGEFVSERLKRTVTLERVDGLWEQNGPLLVLHDIHIAAATPDRPAIVIPQAELKINFFSWLHRNQTWNEFRLIGLHLGLVRDVAGNWQLHGLDAVGDDGKSSQGNESNALFDLGALVVRDLHLTIDDAMADRKIALVADEVRLINSGAHHRVLARVRCLQTQSPPLDVVLDYNSDDRSGEAYLGGAQLDLATILHGYPLAGVMLERGNGRTQLWSWWRAGRLMQARAEADLTGVVLTTQAPITLDDRRQIAPHVGFDRLAFGARWQRTETGWNADVTDLALTRQGDAAPPADIHVESYHAVADAESSGYALHVYNVDLAAPASVAMLSDALAQSWRRWLYAADPVGTLRAATLRVDSAQDFDIAMSFNAVAWHAVDRLPGVSGLSGTLRGDRDAFSLTLPADSAFGIDAPQVFRQPLEFSEFAGDIAVYRADVGWRAETGALAFEGAGYGGELGGAIELHDDGSPPLLDVYAALTHAQVAASHLFWPINAMSAHGVSVLDRALESGHVTSARAVFRGDLADWPFRNFAGRFEARADTDDVRLVYLPDWPAAEHARGVADFLNNSLHVDVTAAQAQGVKVSTATLDIPDLGEVVLDLSVTGGGAGKDLLGFLKATPIGLRYGAPLLGVDVGGQGKLDFKLHLPVKYPDQLELAGSAVLADADLADAKYNLHLNKASGKLRFTQRGFAADDLAVTMNGKPADFSLAVGGLTADPRHAVEANLQATMPARDVLAYAPVLESYSDRLSGSALWNAGFSADSDAEVATAQRLTLTSDLRGVKLDLPAPLRKAADTALPLTLTLGLPFAGGTIDLRLADLVHMQGRLASPSKPFAARVDFGSDSGAPLPTAGFAIGGTVSRLDLSGWLDFATSGSGGSGDLLAGIDLNAQSLNAYDRDFGANRFKLTHASDGLDLGFNGANLDGSLHVPTTDLRKRGITAQFTRLYWPDAAESESSAMAGENPAAVPSLHIHIGDFKLGQANFGDTTLESYPIAEGTHFEQVSTHSNNVEMRAHGDWTGRPGSDISKFSIDFSAHNLGHMLDAFGYAGVVDGGETVAHVEGSWAGSPSTFALARLDGTLKASVQQGRIPEANPGAGRIFGLFNLGAIPRRLSLDFGDLFKSGFSFDSINALFTLRNGDAYTSDLQVKGPTADIVVSGRIGLKAKDYDQIMDVTPHVGGTLAVGGALVGGPVGAAAGALLQGIFKNQINHATRIRYSVTGGWEKPVITELSKEPVKPAKSNGAEGKAGANAGLRGKGL
ncbi:MAG: YhdP family protein [Rudaea sp.]|nr:YhdP family protein [Rudaea sp.]